MPLKKIKPPHWKNCLQRTLSPTRMGPAVLISRNGEAVYLATITGTTQGIDQIMWIMRPSKLTAVFTFVATLTGAKGPHHSRLISPYLSLCSAVSQIGRLSGHSKYKTESAPWRLGRRTGGNYAEEENNTGVSAISHLRHAD